MTDANIRSPISANNRDPGPTQGAPSTSGLVVTQVAFLRRYRRRPAHPFDEYHQQWQAEEQDRRRKQGESGPGKTGHPRGQQSPEHRTQETTRTDESEKAARLPWIEDLVGIGPELRDRYGKCHTQPNIVEGGNPSVTETEEIEEKDQTEHVEESRYKDQHWQPQSRRCPGVDDQNRNRNRCHREIDPGKILRAQGVDEGRLPDSLGRKVYCGENQEIEEEQPCEGPFAGSNAEDGAPKTSTRAGGGAPISGEPIRSPHS
jgi:hypothetical protein